MTHGSKSGGSSTVQKYLAKLPKFEEGQGEDVFLRSFKKMADSQKWEKLTIK